MTFETTKVTDPIQFYEINRVHIIHYVRDTSNQSNNVYQEFYDRVKEIIKSDSPREVEVVEHIGKVSDFTLMLKTVLQILESEHAEAEKSGEDCEIFVNISSGSSEYAAASAIAAMMVPGTVPFSVGTKEYTVDAEGVKRNYYIDSKPVGLTKTTFDPRSLPSYSIQIPEEHLVRGLRILDQRNAAKQSVTSGKMVAALKEAKLWYRDTDSVSSERKTSQRQTEAVYYQRDFINKWLENGWIRKDDLTGRYVVTYAGRNITSTFYTLE
ncbi:MAG: hypothetical protein E7Z64_00955 [Thermoplasmata archaeon]|nr:hypothetical protein [Thermoplasmata archaeon]